MHARALGLIFGLLIGGHVLAQMQNTQQPRPLLASVEARWEHVYCDLTEVTRTSAGDLNVRYQYRNTKTVAQRLPHANLVPETQVLD